VAAGLLAAGLLLFPGQARADGYGHAEISLGFPHGAITVGRIWEEHPRQVVVEEVTHKYPEADDEAEPEDEGYYDEESADPDVVIEKRIVRPRQVTIVERYREPVQVVRQVYVERPACAPQVVVYGRPAVRVVRAPSHTVIVAPRTAYRGGGWRESGHGWHSESRGSRGSHIGGDDRGPRDLFPEDHGRPARMRGVRQNLVQVGAHH
jgi:hypothetical protein